MHSPIPQPASHAASKPLARPPFRIEFDIRPNVDGTNEAAKSANRNAYERCKLHFGRALWALPNGTLVRKSISLGIKARLGGTTPRVVATIDLNERSNGLHAQILPARGERFRELKSGFSDDRWMLRLSDPDDPGYSDSIICVNRRFFLSSITERLNSRET